MVVNVNFANNVTRKDVTVSDEATVREVIAQMDVPEASSYMLNGITLNESDLNKPLRDIVAAETYHLRTVKPGDGNHSNQ